MKKSIVLISIGLLGAGCFWHKTSPSAPEATTVEAVITQEPAASVRTTQKTEEKQVSQVPASAAVVAVSVPRVASTPAKQSFVPAPDKAVFKNEPLLSLEGRSLSPLSALSPVSDRQIPSAWKGEQLKSGLYYSFVKVGTAYIKNRGVVETDGRQAYVIQTSAFSASVIDKVFKVRDINLSWLDTKNLYSLGYSQSLREGKYRRDEWVTFDYDTNTYTGEVTKKSGTRTFSGQLTHPVLDMLTSLYFVRGQTLQDGKDVVFDILNREEQYPLVVKVIKRETVKTPAGKFNCVVVEPQFRGEGIFVSKGKSLQVWLTDDERKLPVKMKTEVFIGSVSAELLEYKYN